MFVNNKYSNIKLVENPLPVNENQIYKALTILIEDETELIEDMFGRYGSLINIGDMYLFQPKNVTSKNASRFVRQFNSR